MNAPPRFAPYPEVRPPSYARWLAAGTTLLALLGAAGVFLRPFMAPEGTALLAAVCVGVSLMAWSGQRSLWLMAAGLLYLAGTFVVTAVFNVPRNERLARMEASSSDAVAHWPVYVLEWTRWNHVRTAAALASAACALMVLS